MIIQFNSAAGDQESTDRTATTLWSKRHAVADRPAAGVHGPTRLPARLASDSRRGLCTATTREAAGRTCLSKVSGHFVILCCGELVSCVCQLSVSPISSSFDLITPFNEKSTGQLVVLQTPVLQNTTLGRDQQFCKKIGSPRLLLGQSCRPLFCRIPRWALRLLNPRPLERVKGRALFV